MPIRRRHGFQPSLNAERLESRRLLDGSSVIARPGGPDQDIINLENQVQAFVSSNHIAVSINVPSISMADKAAEIKEINDIRNKFNVAVDAVRAVDAEEIKALTDLTVQIDAKVAELNPADPAQLAKAAEYLNVRSQIVTDISNTKAHDAAMKTFRDKVNAAVDAIIANIKGKVWMMNSTSWTVYFSDGYSATA